MNVEIDLDTVFSNVIVLVGGLWPVAAIPIFIMLAHAVIKTVFGDERYAPGAGFTEVKPAPPTVIERAAPILGVHRETVTCCAYCGSEEPGKGECPGCGSRQRVKKVVNVIYAG